MNDFPSIQEILDKNNENQQQSVAGFKLEKNTKTKRFKLVKRHHHRSGPIIVICLSNRTCSNS